MSHPLVVHSKQAHYDVLVCRPSKWGNPFHIGRDGTRSEVIVKYRQWIVQQPELMAALHELRGKRLGCWCSPKACHGDVLAELANESAGLFGVQNCKKNISKAGAPMSKKQNDDDDGDDGDLFIQALSKERQKLMASRGVPGQDQIPKRSKISVVDSLVKMEPTIPRVLSKPIVTGKQLKNLNHILEHPLRSAYTLAIGSFPSDMKAKHMAIMVMNAAIDEHLRNRKPGRSLPLWHRVYGGLGDALRDKPIIDMPSMLIISNLSADSSAFKLEKVRDLLEKFSDIPRIIVTGGEPPVDLFANKLHYPLKSAIYLGPANMVRES